MNSLDVRALGWVRIDRDDPRTIDKEDRDVCINLRLGPIGQEHAEETLAAEIAGVETVGSLDRCAPGLQM